MGGNGDDVNTYDKKITLSTSLAIDLYMSTKKMATLSVLGFFYFVNSVR